MSSKIDRKHILQLDNALMLILRANRNEIDGRTTLQKLMYLCSQRVQVEGTEDFKPSYYGPYSANLTEAIERSVGLKFLREEPRITRRDHVSYRYSLGEDVIGIIDKLEQTYSVQFEKISKIVADANSYCGLNPYALSYAAKVHYMLKQGKKPIDFRAAARKAEEFDWKMNEGQAKAGIDLLLALRFAKKNSN